ncbi:hypothetical protein LN042_11350 [Kitasatospora sp. RB6PN24]|uniref:hypothetical protein n=1 Tax=Kitasatospora humi TaxID=2893891 RepID=UPI001E47DFCF|nr:hypothetical protein [Kitasatospora humi]MCC9307691.1 hypothetical protein [Kitasatospora humi]
MSAYAQVTPVDANGNILGGPGGRLFRDSAATVQASGTPTAPGAGAAVASVTVPAAGLWEVVCSYWLSGTVAAGDANNLQLKQGATVRLTPLPVPAVVNTLPPRLTVVLNCAAGDTVSLNAIAGGSASAVYNAVLVARQVG